MAEKIISNYIIDFDSTFIKVETLDVLCEVALEGNENKATVLAEIKSLTNQGMDGKITLQESLTKRLHLMKCNKTHIAKTIIELKKQISPSFVRNKAFLQANKETVYIISGGFKEIIDPIIAEFSIKTENVFANTFLFDSSDNIIGFDETNLLSQTKGKPNLIKKLDLQGDVFVIGDGYTDYEIKEAGLANKFFAFTENVSRSAVTSKADHIVPSFDEFLFINNLPMSISYPKSRINVLLLENIHPAAVQIFKDEGYNVETIKGALDEAELIEKIKNVSILGLRSKTMLTAKVLEHANKLMAVGAFCIGTNQVDLATCMKMGIAVFNAPFSNTRSVVELALGEIIMLSRNIFTKSDKMHQGVWDKSAGNSFEVRGKKLGILGYGNIGTQLSVVAEALGMQVYFYDVVDKLSLGNARRCDSLEELLKTVDILSLHVDGRASNKDLISFKEFDLMKKGSYLVNLSRGHLIHIPALVENIKSGKIIGTAVDVFPDEPKTNDEEFISELRNLDNVILTPHIGGSTEEAQSNIGHYVPGKIIDYINSGSTYMSVNFPNIQLPELKDANRFIHIHDNVSGILAKINQVFAHNNANILGQYLKTNENIGYVITDIAKSHTDHIIGELKSINNTIKFRILY